MSFDTPGVFVGMLVTGVCPLILVLVKCMSSFFTSLVFRLCWWSHLWVSSNVTMSIWDIASSVGPEARIAPSSTYKVIGDNVTWFVQERRLNSGSCSKRWDEFLWISLIIGDVKNVASIGDMQEPCGIPVSTGCSSSLFPSRHRAVFLSCRKEWTHRTMGRGM